jgi:hypothetical protein
MPNQVPPWLEERVIAGGIEVAPVGVKVGQLPEGVDGRAAPSPTPPSLAT